MMQKMDRTDREGAAEGHSEGKAKENKTKHRKQQTSHVRGDAGALGYRGRTK
jgi:hypothetical protein